MQLLATWCLLGELFLAVAASQNRLSNTSLPSVKLADSQSTKKVSGGASNTSKSISTPAAQPQVKRARLDVGFASFEKSMMDQILTSLHNATDSDHLWTQQLQLACKENVTQAVSQGLKSTLAPLKQTIGKTWMSLPEDEQKNAYVEQLKLAYDGVFKDVMGTIDTHLQRSLQRLRIHPTSRKVSQDELITECASSITGNLISERCYDIGGGQHLKKVSSFLEMKASAPKAPKNFCMPSVLEALTKRLVDSQGLIGMTMQFESKSLSLSAAPSAIDDIVKLR